MKIIFNEAIEPIKNLHGKSFGNLMQVKLDSVEFRKSVRGSLIPRPRSTKSSQKSRKLGKKKRSRSLKKFEWYPLLQGDNFFTIQIKFNNPKLISRLLEGADTLDF